MQMLAALRQRFGRPLPSVGGLAFAAFPSAERLAAAEEAELRALGLGYRAKFVISTAKRVQSLGGESWLASLRGLTRQAATTELQSLAGVGPKVADCVALFSLDQASAIPVDTHVWAIACRDMDPSLKQAKSLTPKVYDRVVQLFTDRFGAHAGWAHCVLFSAELPAFRRELPEPMQRAIEAFAAEERAAKAAKRRAKRARTADADEPAKRARAPKRQRESIPESTGGTGP